MHFNFILDQIKLTMYKNICTRNEKLETYTAIIIWTKATEIRKRKHAKYLAFRNAASGSAGHHIAHKCAK